MFLIFKQPEPILSANYNTKCHFSVLKCVNNHKDRATVYYSIELTVEMMAIQVRKQFILIM